MLKRRDLRRQGRPRGGAAGSRRPAPRVEGLEGRQLLANSIIEYPIPTAAAGAFFITPGPAGTVWFTENSASKIGRFNPTAGAVTAEFPTRTALSGPEGITEGPDGNLWFAENTAGKIGRITPSGVVTEFPIPTPNSAPVGIAAGPDGNLYFTESGGNAIGRINPATGAIAQFPIPTANSVPVGITEGPDGNLWFAESKVGKIGRFNPTTHAIVSFSTSSSASGPFGITTGADGNLWFTESGVNKIGRLNPSTASLIEVTVPTAGSKPAGITSGPDNNIWFTEEVGNNVGEVNLTAGTLTENPIPTAQSEPLGIAPGPDGNLYFTQSFGNNIGELVIPKTGTLTALLVNQQPGIVGNPAQLTVITFTPAGGGVPTGTVTVSVDGHALPAARLTSLLGRGYASLKTAPLSAGVHRIVAVYNGNAAFNASSAIQALDVVAAPTVTSVRRLGVHAQPTSLVLTFSQPMDPASVQNPANYTLHAPSGQPIFIASAVYDPAANTVTLRPRLPLNVHRSYQLTVNGAFRFGLRNTAGIFLGGQGANMAGTSFVTTINAGTLFTPARAAAHATALPGPRKVR